jgi:hypothetical protein
VKTFTRQKFADLSSGPGGRLTDARFERCEFVTPWLYTRAGVFFEAERLEFRNCKVRGRGLSKLICRELELEHVKRNPLLRITNSLFDRVRFTGDFGKWFFCWLPDHLTEAELELCERFYDEVPYALDLRGARFQSITLRGIPGDKILRDPETSILVRRATLERSSGWQDAPGIWPKLLQLFLDEQPAYASTVFVASTLGADHDEDLAEFQQLREAGWAE